MRVPDAQVAAAAVGAFKAAAVLQALLKAGGGLGEGMLGDLRELYGEEVAYVLSKPRVLARMDRRGGPGAMFAGMAAKIVREVVGWVRDGSVTVRGGAEAGLPTF